MKLEKSQIKDKSLKQILNNNHIVVANTRKTKRQISLEYFFALCKTVTKVAQKMGCPNFLEKAELQDFVYTTSGVDNNLTIESLDLFVPIFTPERDT